MMNFLKVVEMKVVIDVEEHTPVVSRVMEH
jgi:hypothetical protein